MDRISFAECDRYGAEIRYEIEVNADVIKAENPDIVILATGAEPIVLPVEGKETMIQANDVLSGKVPILGGNAAIIEEEWLNRNGGICASSFQRSGKSSSYRDDRQHRSGNGFRIILCRLWLVSDRKMYR